MRFFCQKEVLIDYTKMVFLIAFLGRKKIVIFRDVSVTLKFNVRPKQEQY